MNALATALTASGSIGFDQSAPRFIDHLGADSRDRFHTTLRALEAIGVKAEVDPSIVRGFDYYTHTVYEVQCSDLGARSAICGGGQAGKASNDSDSRAGKRSEGRGMRGVSLA